MSGTSAIEWTGAFPVVGCQPGRCAHCVCDPTTCATDDTGEHCETRNCGSCLHGCPTDSCWPGTQIPLPAATEGTP